MLGIKDLGIKKAFTSFFKKITSKTAESRENIEIPVAVKVLEVVPVDYTELAADENNYSDDWTVIAKEAPDEEIPVALNVLEVPPVDYIELAADEANISDDWIVITKEETQNSVQMHNLGVETEYLSKVAAYKLAIPRDQNADAALATQQELSNKGYFLEKLGSPDFSKKNGVFLYALVKKDTSEPITIVCRGTHTDASIITDLDPNGPGASAMEEMRPLVMNQINELAKKYPGRKIRITGHSLGGALAQIITSNILEEKKHIILDEPNISCPAFIEITGVETVLFQSAWVHDSVIELAGNNAQKIKDLDASFDISLFSHIKQGDFVSRTGGTLFPNIDSSVVRVTMDMRSLDKPRVTLGDAMELGFTIAAVGANPFLTTMAATKIALTRYGQNRLEAHTDFFYHDKTDKTYSTMLPGAYGLYTNADLKQREYIEHVFNKNDRQYIPLHSEISGKIFERTRCLNSEELRAAAFCGVAVVAAIPLVADIATCLFSSAAQGALTIVKHGPKIARHSGALVENQGTGLIALKKCVTPQVARSSKHSEWKR